MNKEAKAKRVNWVHLFFLTGFVLFLTQCFGQSKVGYQWTFGDRQSIDFNGGTPTPKYFSSQLAARHGCASIADTAGRMLFYTNGYNIWDSIDNKMPNASDDIGGNPWASQTALIMPVANENGRYYLFINDGCGSFFSDCNGLSYTIVDLSLPGNGTDMYPLGDIDTNYIKEELGYSALSIPMVDSTSGKLTAAIHANGMDYWIITRKSLKNEFYAFLVTCAGISETPVVSIAGNDTSVDVGWLRSSLDGKCLVAAEYWDNVYMFDFDNATGVVSNAQTISQNGGWFYDYQGVEFSPNDSLIYVAANGSHRGIYRYERFASDVSATETHFNPGVLHDFDPTSLQMGPYGETIYTSMYYLYHVLSIKDPNNLSDPYLITVDSADAIHTAHGGHDTKESLPNFFNAYMLGNLANPPVPASGFAGSEVFICPGGAVQIGVDTTYSFSSYLWTPSISPSADTVPNPIVSPDTSTQYVLALTIACSTYYDTVMVNVTEEPFFTLGNDTAICEGDSIVLGGFTPQWNYQWSTGDTSDQLTVMAEGEYWIEAFDTSQCSFRDSIIVALENNPIINTTPDAAVIGLGDAVQIMTSGGIQYNWQPVDFLSCSDCPNPISMPSQNMVYYVNVTDANGCSNIDSVKVFIEEKPIVISNTITPNEDGDNDFWVIGNIEYYPNNHLEIFGRNGAKLFETNSYQNDWNGIWEGKKLPAGVYFFILNPGNGLEEEKGTITIIR